MHSSVLNYLILILLTATTTVSAQGYWFSCQGSQLVGSRLYSLCQTLTNGVYKPTNLNLDQCVGNYGGALACGSEGGYSGSCQNCQLETDPNGNRLPYLQCDCHGPAGLQTTSMNTNDCVSNAGGTLGCYGHSG